MANLNSDSPVSDIHICGRCRAEFNDIYKFINHKKHCGTIKNNADSVPIPIPNQDGSRFIDEGNHSSHVNRSTFQPDNQCSVKNLPHTKTAEQPFYSEERNIYICTSDQHSNEALNLCYEGVAQHEINSFAYSNPSSVVKPDQSRLEYDIFEVSSINQQSLAQKSSNLDTSTTLPVIATATSQELLNSTGAMGIPSVSDSVADSSALCPEDLEVGQISEAMMGKLSQKSFPNEPGLLSRKLEDENSNKRVGRLDPISTFTLRRKSSKTSTTAAKPYTRSLPFNANRINSSSAPLAADCEEDESPVDHLDLKGISFEKRERLQGVSDDLLNPSPSTSIISKNVDGKSSIQLQGAVESSSGHNKAYSQENVSKSNSIYKAVFTSPSCGGHRLSVKLPDEENRSLTSKHLQQLSHVPSHEKEIMNRINLEERTCSMSYKNISNLPDVSRNEVESVMPNALDLERSESLISDSNMETKASFIAQHYEEVGTAQQMDRPTLKTEQIYPTIPNSIQKDNGDGMSNVISSAPVIHNSNNGIVLEMKADNMRHSGSLVTTEYNSWEPEEIQVIASTDQMNYLHLTGAGDENKEIEFSLKNENYKVEGDDTMVLVYKREDGNLIMMCKPNYSTCDSSSDNNIESAWQAMIESVVNDGTFGVIQQDHQPVHSVTQQQAESNLDCKGKQTNDHDKSNRKVKGSSPRAKEKSLRKIAKKSSCATDETTDSGLKSVDSNVKKTVRGSGSNKIFTCNFGNCSYSTKLDKDFQRHYRTHTGERPFKCEKCDTTFNRSDKLKNHLRCHEGQKPFQCKLCKYATTDNSSLKKHLRIHTDERPYQCQICPYASRNSSQLIVHLRTHTGDAPFHCNFCSAQFKINSDLKRHLRTHTGEKPFACDKCDYKSSNKGNLKSHHRINHSLENEKPCSQCSFVTSSMKRLKEHIKIHDQARIVKCSVCQYTCNSSTALRSHMMVHNTLRPFRCTFCPYSSKQSGNLKKHMQNVHHEKHRQTGPSSSSSSSGSTLKHSSSVEKSHRSSSSSALRKQSKSREDNSNHKGNVNLKSDHHHQRPARRPSSSRKIHVCPECGCGFVRHDSLRCHLKQHSDKESSAKDITKQTDITLSPKKNQLSTSGNEQKTSISSCSKSILQTPAPPSLHPPSIPLSPQQQLQQAPPQTFLQPPPHPPTNYRSKGLDSIVAAASQLYREQYMNGKDDDDDDNERPLINNNPTQSIKSCSTTKGLIIDLENKTYTFDNEQSHADPVFQHSNDNKDAGDNALSSSAPITDTLMIQQCYKNVVNKRQKREGLLGDEDEAQPSGKKPKIRRNSSVSRDLKLQYRSIEGGITNINASSGQVPWEHRSYTSFSSDDKSHLTEIAADSISSSSSSCTLSTTSSKVTRSQDNSMSKLSSSSSSSSISLSSPRYVNHHNQQHRNDNGSQIHIQQLHPPSQNQSTAFQYGTVSASNMEVSVPSQPISIQLVPQATNILHPPPTSQSQNLISNISFPQHPLGIQQPATAVQILLPAGSQMTQIIQPPPSLAPVGAGTGVVSLQQQESVIGQPQIVFQVQEAPSMAATRQDIVTLPTSIATQQVVLGQCPTYGIAQNQVISSPADSTTIGGMYTVTERLGVDNATLTEFHSSVVTSQRGAPLA